jgi:Family of unknown function (DUF5681)
MISGKRKSAPYQVGYGKPPRHAQFRKGRSGNPGGRPRRPVTERAKELALREAYRRITVKEDGRAVALPAILRSQVVLAAKGNVQAQRAVLAAIQTIEHDNVFAAELAALRDVPAQVLVAPSTIEQNYAEAAALAAHNAGTTMSYAEAARRIKALLRLDDEEPTLDSEKDVAGASASGTTDASAVKPGAVQSQAK